MQTLILKIDEIYLNSLMEFIKPLPEDKCEFRLDDRNFDFSIDMLENESAYKSALDDLKNGDAIELNTYMANRGVA